MIQMLQSRNLVFDFLGKVAGGGKGKGKVTKFTRAQRVFVNIEHLQFIKRAAKVRQVRLVADLVVMYV